MPQLTDARARDLSIGELSRQTGVNIETIRYYEKIGVLAHPPRTPSGRRLYGAAQRRTLAFVRRARNLGFTLDEIRALLKLGGPEKAPCAEVRTIASHHLADIREKLSDLRRLERVLSDTIAKCATGRAPKCPIIEVLDSGPT
jgi:MerR family mercuric resistance operon transcriptional regulator